MVFPAVWCGALIPLSPLPLFTAKNRRKELRSNRAVLHNVGHFWDKEEISIAFDKNMIQYNIGW
jgi:hypothetical protein